MLYVALAVEHLRNLRPHQLSGEVGDLAMAPNLPPRVRAGSYNDGLQICPQMPCQDQNCPATSLLPIGGKDWRRLRLMMVMSTPIGIVEVRKDRYI